MQQHWQIAIEKQNPLSSQYIRKLPGNSYLVKLKYKQETEDSPVIIFLC